MASRKIKLLVVLIILVIAIHSTVAALKTFRVQETDLVKMAAEAVDADGDAITYQYSSPLDEKGEWQTGYDDAGEYPVTITASDGAAKTEEKVLLIVENKNRPPAVTETKVVVKETQSLDLKNFVTDPDGDLLRYAFTTPFDRNGVWETSYGDAGTHVVDFMVSDPEVTVKARVEVDVLNTNQPPQIANSFSSDNVVKVKEGGNLHFYVAAEDSDNDELVYIWKLDGKVVSEKKECTHYFDFDSSGEHELTLSVSDGNKEVLQEWLLTVEDVNRKPELDLAPITLQEGEKAVLELPEKDLDGNKLTYSFAEKFNYFGVWDTGFDDAGEHEVVVYASDGEFTAESAVKVTVIDVDRAPELNLPRHVDVYEGQDFSLVVDAVDPDGDDVTIHLENAPEGSSLFQTRGEFSWQPGYDFIQRKGGFVSNVLNALRLENLFLSVRTVPVTVTSCGKDLCVSKQLNLLVHNVNRAPVLENVLNITASETETVFLTPKAVDPDGDIVRVTFSAPFNPKGAWKTDYDDEGQHLAYVAATDGRTTTTFPVEVNIVKSNRQPSLLVENDEVVVDEGGALSFTVRATDPDNDEVSIRLESTPSGASFAEGVFSWQPGFETVLARNATDNLVGESQSFNAEVSKEDETLWLTFVASDGEFDVVHPVKVVVKNVNQKPAILDYLPTEVVTARLHQPVVFHVAAKDIDGDQLHYRWDFGLGEKKVTGTDTIERTFTALGEKRVMVVVSDGPKEIAKEWLVQVVDEPVADAPVHFSAEDFKVYVVETRS